jgi:protein-L-isoaspartate(D-aspartate) O-methyltransferase
MPFNFLRSPAGDEHFDREREVMVQTQLAHRGIVDEAVLRAFLSVPRHRFVEGQKPSYAYRDHPIPIPCGQTVSQPYVVAYMLQKLCLRNTDSALEIGTGSGYQTALVAEIVRSVSTIEYHTSLVEPARRTLSGLGYSNIAFHTGDGSKGWPDAETEFDAIIGSAAASTVPSSVVAQLAPGGRMILPVGGRHQKLLLIHRSDDGGALRETQLLPVRFVPMLTG